MSFSFVYLSRECKVPLFIREPISSEEVEALSVETGREVGCWAGLRHSAEIEPEIASQLLTSDSSSEQ